MFGYPSPFSLGECSHKIIDKAATRNWGQYIDHHQKTKGIVDHREHTAFLNLWLDHFLFCGSSLAPTKNYLNLANALADGRRLALGKLFLGVFYRHLSLNNTRLLSGDRIRAGGPWWFLQLLCQLYFSPSIPDFPRLVDLSFPNPAGNPIRCTSFGQALYRLPGSRPDEKETAKWFKLFYHDQTQISFSVYSESVNFENPSIFRLDTFADDDDTRAQYALMIRPCLLPMSMSTSNRITKPGYEAYQPVVAARQLGLNQIPPSFIIHENFQSRANLTESLIASRAYNLFSHLVIPIPCDLEFTYSKVGFDTWWSY